ncbi:hypothetical protein SAMD00019534_119940 [Acytostelium subglobosum LB1]|uniref:hypothetical protein n=1 Tax=Acytostelium subglobosum LB1 TaxID=1410327 RepID=UPI0006450C10|nr:hypothetical protein SAMD00019534_119940 [Acytostelium subglobosum LB1]GAM28818.1 hypothetical protein SAMD00019534_119940 [Acytostelium subglobosum LB1]|eukprot:XP_012748190.1 hypothetical protein SAMD00019534_119940 [Acytostelium subglobosum LB1]
MVICPECSTEYEKEAKYCFKCRIPFTDDIPDNIRRYLRGGAASPGIGHRAITTPLNPSSFEKPPLQRNVSLPTVLNAKGAPVAISNPPPPSLTSSLNNNNINNINSYVSSSPPNNNNNTSILANVNTTTFATTATPSTPTSSLNRPRQQSTPIPPSHPLPQLPPNKSASSLHLHQTAPKSTGRQPPLPPMTSSPPNGIGQSSSRSATNLMSLKSPSSSPEPTPYTGGSDIDSPGSVKRPLSRRIPPPPPTAGKKLVRAVWDCISEQEGDLEFYVGDIISVISKDEGGWWMGTVHGRTGMFPANYVEEMDQ